jgi:hypothetical protein
MIGKVNERIMTDAVYEELLQPRARERLMRLLFLGWNIRNYFLFSGESNEIMARKKE